MQLQSESHIVQMSVDKVKLPHPIPEQNVPERATIHRSIATGQNDEGRL